MTQTENSTAKPKSQPKKLMLIRFGKMGALGWFEHNETQIPQTKTYAIIKTSRGLELGQIVGMGNYHTGHFRNTPEQVEAYFGPTETGQPVVTETGSFVRFAVSEDLREQQHLEQSAVAEAKTCEKLAEEMNLPMKIIEAEHLFGGERIVIYFTSEGRVDFRELVKRMAKEYQTRIELRQIGSRDEARLIGDYETCGQECCCKRFLKILAPVNMRMAKLQKATLDPSKISGHCGRLKCCLRYEDSTYLELREKLPKKNVLVSTPQGQGRIVDVQILTQLVVVQFDNGDRQAWPLEEVHVLDNQTPLAADLQKPQDQEKKPVVTAKKLEKPEQVESEMEDTTQPIRSEDPQKAAASEETVGAKPEVLPQEQKDRQNRSEQNTPQNRNDFNNRRNKKNKFKNKRSHNNRNNPSNPNHGGQQPNSGQNPPQTPRE
jgi:cell fate regulator YaaT (PSP1 superfamily)